MGGLYTKHLVHLFLLYYSLSNVVFSYIRKIGKCNYHSIKEKNTLFDRNKSLQYTKERKKPNWNVFFLKSVNFLSKCFIACEYIREAISLNIKETFLCTYVAFRKILSSFRLLTYFF